MKFIKGIALVTPLILSIILLVGVFGRAFAPVTVSEVTIEVIPENSTESIGGSELANEASMAYAAYREYLQSDYNNRAERLEAQFDLLMAVIGVAVTTWIGLNVYNAAEKKQVDDLAKKSAQLEEKIAKSQQKINELEQAIESGIAARFS